VQTEKRKNEHDDDDEPDEINYSIHTTDLQEIVDERLIHSHNSSAVAKFLSVCRPSVSLVKVLHCINMHQSPVVTGKLLPVRTRRGQCRAARFRKFGDAKSNAGEQGAWLRIRRSDENFPSSRRGWTATSHS
jgi:hypothetical protein